MEATDEQGNKYSISYSQELQQAIKNQLEENNKHSKITIKMLFIAICVGAVIIGLFLALLFTGWIGTYLTHAVC